MVWTPAQKREARLAKARGEGKRLYTTEQRQQDADQLSLERGFVDTGTQTEDLPHSFKVGDFVHIRREFHYMIGLSPCEERFRFRLTKWKNYVRAWYIIYAGGPGKDKPFYLDMPEACLVRA